LGQHFPRHFRLLNSADYRCVFAVNHRLADRYWTILYRHSTADDSRLGMAVAKKHIRRAVDRNRLKRLIRESFRTGVIPVTVDIVVMPRASCLGADNGELIISLHKQWSRISSKCAKQCAT